jgi:membrane-bound serine protease (ClpP class)
MAMAAAGVEAVSAVRSGSRNWCHIAQWLALGTLLIPAGLYATDTTEPATLIEINGAIGPAMSRYVERALMDAATHHSSAAILQMDTPGGLDTSMRDIIKAILASPIPVVTYVAPSGARAASAGTYILYASHIAAMAPATNLGAATPISIGGESPAATPEPGKSPESHDAPKSSEHDAPKSSDTPAPASAGERKAVNDAVAYIRSLAQLRGRNADWAEAAVRGAASLSAQDALSQHVVEIIAKDVPDLLRQLDGRKALVAERPTVLHTEGAAVTRVAPDWRDRLLMVLTHPTIAYGLLLIGIYGLLLEGYNPGVVLPGVAGALSLILALYAFQLLAVNYAGLALIALGATLIVMEFFMPAFGSLGVGGLIAFVIGSIILFDNRSQGLQMALPLIAGVAIAGALLIATIAWLAAQARRRPVATGSEAMLGRTVEVVAADRDHCVVRYGGELWSAQAAGALRVGQQGRIIKVDGLTLWIEPQ